MSISEVGPNTEIWAGEVGDHHNNEVAHDDPLWLAIESGDLRAVRGYLEQNPELLNGTGQQGTTPLQHALKHGQAKIACFLMGHGADPTFRLDLTSPGPDGKTPLMSALERGDKDAIKMLIRLGAPVTEEAKTLADELGLSDLLEAPTGPREPFNLIDYLHMRA